MTKKPSLSLGKKRERKLNYEKTETTLLECWLILTKILLFFSLSSILPTESDAKWTERNPWKNFEPFDPKLQTWCDEKVCKAISHQSEAIKRRGDKNSWKILKKTTATEMVRVHVFKCIAWGFWTQNLYKNTVFVDLLVFVNVDYALLT